MGQPIDHSLETLSLDMTATATVSVLSVPPTKGVKERRTLVRQKWESFFAQKPLWIAVPQVTSLPDNWQRRFVSPWDLVIRQQLGRFTNLRAWMTRRSARLRGRRKYSQAAQKSKKLQTDSRLQCLYNIMVLPVKTIRHAVSMVSGRSNLFSYQI